MLNPFVCMYINNVICVSKVLYFFPVFKYFVKTLFGGNKKKRKCIMSLSANILITAKFHCDLTCLNGGQATFATEKHQLGKILFSINPLFNGT